MPVSAFFNVAKLSLYQDIAKTGFDERLNVCSKLGYGWYVECKGYLVIHGQKITVLQAKVQPDRGIYSGIREVSWPGSVSVWRFCGRAINSKVRQET